MAEASRPYGRAVLLDSPPYLPPGDGGPTDRFRRATARFSTGPAHAARRAGVDAVLARLDPADLRERAATTGDAVAALLAGLGLAGELTGWVPRIAAVYQGGAADDEVAAALELVTVEELTVLVQACAATAALARAAVDLPGTPEEAVAAALDPPPVPATRRVLPDGSVVSVDLTGTPFGAGPHRCPGEPHALALAAGLVERWRR